jgi:carboxyl-terminal processing protease
MEIRIRVKKWLVLAGGSLILSTGYKTYDDLFEFSKNLEIFSAAYKQVGINFVDGVNPGDLMRKGLDAMLASLDPYTNFYSEAQTEEAMIERQGEYGGVGCRVIIKDNYPVVSEVFRGFAFSKADIRQGDIIRRIAGQDMAGKTTGDVGAFLRGAPNTTVTLLVERSGKQMEKSVTRVSVRTKNVPYYGMINPQTGYVKLDEFGSNCGQEIENAVLALKKNEGIQNLILDLRDNGGGLLAEAVKIVGLFVGEGKLVVDMRGRTPESNRKWMTERPAIAANLKLIVLVNAKSASASEIVSGSLQDMDRAVIIGRNSFGKGLVQNFFQLPFRTQMKITTSKYYTPSGRCIQLLDYSKRNADGSAGTIPDSLRKAFKTNAGRTVYDGGGIRPDIAVDEFGGESLFKYIVEEQLLFEYANTYRNSHETITDGSAVPTDAEYNAFEAECLAKLTGLLRKKIQDLLLKNIPDSDLVKTIMAGMSDTQISASLKEHMTHFKTALRFRLGMEIMSRYNNDEIYHKYMFAGDPDVSAALNIIANPDAYSKLLKP